MTEYSEFFNNPAINLRDPKENYKNGVAFEEKGEFFNALYLYINAFDDLKESPSFDIDLYRNICKKLIALEKNFAEGKIKVPGVKYSEITNILRDRYPGEPKEDLIFVMDVVSAKQNLLRQRYDSDKDLQTIKKTFPELTAPIQIKDLIKKLEAQIKNDKPVQHPTPEEHRQLMGELNYIEVGPVPRT